MKKWIALACSCFFFCQGLFSSGGDALQSGDAPRSVLFRAMNLGAFDLGSILLQGNNGTEINPNAPFVDPRPRMFNEEERQAARAYLMLFNLDEVRVDQLLGRIEDWLMRWGGSAANAQRHILLQYFGLRDLNHLALAMNRMEGFDGELTALFTALFEYGPAHVRADLAEGYVADAVERVRGGFSADEVFWMRVYWLEGFSEDMAVQMYRYQQWLLNNHMSEYVWDAHRLASFSVFFVYDALPQVLLERMHEHLAAGFSEVSAMIMALLECQGLVSHERLVPAVQEYYRLLSLGQEISPVVAYFQVLYGAYGLTEPEAARAAREFVQEMHTHGGDASFWSIFYQVFYRACGFSFDLASRASLWALLYHQGNLGVERSIWYGAFRALSVHETALEWCFQRLFSDAHRLLLTPATAFEPVMIAINGIQDLEQGVRVLEEYASHSFVNSRVEALMCVIFAHRYGFGTIDVLLGAVRRYFREGHFVFAVGR